MEKFTFRRQIGNRGCYAEVVYELEITEGSHKGFEIDCRCEEWNVSAKAAAAIYYDYYKRQKTGSVRIVVYGIEWYPIDTDNLIVLFACLKAFVEGSGIIIDDLKVDTVNEFFCFPEARSIFPSE